MPLNIIEDSATTYSTGFLGGTVGMLSSVDWIAVGAGALIVVRFAMDTVRMYYFIKEKRKGK